MCKVKLTFIRPWIAKKVVELVGFEDEVVVEYAMGFLKDKQEPIIKDNATNTVSHVNQSAHPFDKGPLKALLSRRYSYALASEIYWGVLGLYDCGPSNSTLQANDIADWPKHFIMEEPTLELHTTVTIPAPVFGTSGLVVRFADWVGKVIQTADVIRGIISLGRFRRLDWQGGTRGQAAAPAKEDEKAKNKKNKTAKAAAVPLRRRESRAYKAVPWVTFYYLRPETALGYLLKFSCLLDYNNGCVPFASAQRDCSFRNEISPHVGFLCVHEFTLAGIEYFVDPQNKAHPRFKEMRDEVLLLWDRQIQSSSNSTLIKRSIGEAVAKGIIANETRAYFKARIYRFLSKLPRFRPPQSQETMPYAMDCCDAEIQNSTGGTENVGGADQAATGRPLEVPEALKEPIVTEKEVPDSRKKILGKIFSRRAGVLQKPFLILELTPKIFKPSFDLSRMFFTSLEHTYGSREPDVQQGNVLFVPPSA
ncbi:glycyl-tRNA synthetase [Lentinula edodes]|nr:glycyl-tRNA synthetase [Lentinula edodes]